MPKNKPTKTKVIQAGKQSMTKFFTPGNGEKIKKVNHHLPLEQRQDPCNSKGLKDRMINTQPF